MEKTWTITLSDGSTIENLGVNGTNFVSDNEITPDMLKGKLSKIIVKGKVNGEDFQEEYSHIELIQIAHYTDGYYIALRQMSQDELDKIKTQADIEYMAMMTDVDLEV